MDAMRAADGRGEFMLEGAALEGSEQRVDVGDKNVARPPELDGEAGVEHVGTGHPLVYEPRVRSDEFGEMGEEGDDVVPGRLFDLIDPRDVELGLVPFFRIAFAASFGMRPISAIASAAVASISNQMRNRVSGDQICGHLGAGIAGDHRF